MARRGGLGKGLSALIPGDSRDDDDGEVRGAELLELPIESIRPNRFQPRTEFDEDDLEGLAASIAAVGVLQPILVRTSTGSDAEFELIAGERRWRSARRAGLSTIPALVQDHANDLHSLEVALIENLHRADLNSMEEAAAYQQLIDDFDLTHEQVAEAVAKNRVTITNTLRLLNLPPDVQRAIAEGRLTAGHGRALLVIQDPGELEALAAKVAADGLSVRATEELVKSRTFDPPTLEVSTEPGAPVIPRDATHPDAGIAELEHLLERHLETRVKVQLNGKKGKVVVEFADLDDLERIYRAVTGVVHV
jgi:ParB family chromosome partitioning protein